MEASKTFTRGHYLLSAFSNARPEHLIAGVSGGAVATLLLHPLDLVKIRFAVSDGHTATLRSYNGYVSAFRTIVAQEGFRGLYKGVVPNLLGSGASWGFYFAFYTSIKTWVQQGDPTVPLSPASHMLAAAEAGALTLVLTNPIWVLKTRLCLQYSPDEQARLADERRYRGILDGWRKIVRHEGVAGLYRGFVPGLFGVSHGALQFMAYEEMKNRYNQYKNRSINAKLGTAEYLAFAAVSKVFAAGATYPYQVVRARLQDQHHAYGGLVDCIRLTWRFEGWRGFYKGLLANLIRVTPATMITFLTYENVSRWLLKKES